MNLNAKVRFLDEPLQGTVTRIVDDKTVGVTTDDGFEIPVLISKLVYAAGFDEQKPVRQGKPDAVAELDLPAGLFIIFELRFGSYYYVKFVNQFRHNILLTAYKFADGNHSLSLSGEMKPGESLVLDNLDLAEPSKWPVYYFQVLQCIDFSEKLPQVFTSEFRYRATDFMNAKKVGTKVFHHIQLQQKTLAPATETTNTVADPLMAIRRSMAEAKPKEEIRMVERPTETIDLHIDKLTDQYESMNAEESLAYQVQHFEIAFDKGISLDYERMTFIHGVGNGTLKYELRERLSSSKQIKSFRDAQKEKFGYGATEVFFK